MSATALSQYVWASKYRLDRPGDGREPDIEATWRRVAHAIAAAEPQPGPWEKRFQSILTGYLFLPGGRVLAGAGSGKAVTLFNCFVAGRLRDSLDGILNALKETAITMQQGGGVGIDFSPLRPAGSPAERTGTVASGPVTFMNVWDQLCTTLLATSSRRGAMMGTLRCDHPDIEAFIDAKRQADALTNFNLSVLVTDDFMKAIADDSEWPLVFPSADGAEIYKTIPARSLWQRLTAAAYETAEPGLLFVDRINADNNLYYCESISATNPCGEIPLPPYGACDLGSINLAALIDAPFSSRSELDRDRLIQTVPIAIRFLDNVIDVSRFPLPSQARQAEDARRIGLGITGLADALAMMGLHYDSDAARDFAAGTMALIRDTAYAASIDLAEEKGPFPGFDADKYLEAAFVKRLPETLTDRIRRHGMRNSHLLAIAPAGTISLLAGNVSSGMEPIFALEATRSVRTRDLNVEPREVRDFAYEHWLADAGANGAVPDYFATTESLSAHAHLQMQSRLQPFVDNAISKTVTLAATATRDDVAELYLQAYRSGIKGCTVYRPGSERGQVILAGHDIHCCNIEREAD